ncbi:hypothetical protein [Hyphomicrobium sp.]|uniref:hypothetical protein n=1 Tax=Hyphomicrobium sp. TaxID=82 RepID=UPI001DC920CD|nr:hypothetical protein [Hyphomicrobium sp.]MBY0561757.1 hypothetical protein [Hyphomicrobium sp.]
MALRLVVGIGGGVALLAAALALPAEAKIACKKGYQQVQGTWMATPYCQDQYVAQVAHDYGFSASPDRVRNDPLFKQHLCRFIGQDIRIKESCDQAIPSVRGRF